MCTLIVTVNNLRITNKINGKSRICILIIIVLLKISVRPAIYKTEAFSL